MRHERCQSARTESAGIPANLNHCADKAPRRQRADSLWKVAVSATKGLFATSPHAVDSPPFDATRNGSTCSLDALSSSHPPLSSTQTRRNPPRSLLKSRSTPTLKQDAKKQSHRPASDLTSPLLPPVPQFVLSSQSRAAAAPKQRPVISSPYLPRRIDPHNNHTTTNSPHPPKTDRRAFIPTVLNPKPSSKIPRLITTKRDTPRDIEAETAAMRLKLADRSRSKSTPVLRLGRRSPRAQESKLKALISEPTLRPTSPVNRIPSPHTPTVPHTFNGHEVYGPGQCSSPAPSQNSGVSSSSVKRKPVPRFLYSEPPAHSPSAPSSPCPSSLQGLGTPIQAHTTPLHTPLLSSTELILNAISSKGCVKDITLLPIGSGSGSASGSQTSPESSVNGRPMSPSARHRRSASAYNERKQESTTWFGASPASAPATATGAYDEMRGAIDFPGLSPPPPRAQMRVHRSHSRLNMSSADAKANNPQSRPLSHSPPDSPETSRLAALAPLTVAEVRAIRAFLKKHDTGFRARERRKAGVCADDNGGGYDEGQRKEGGGEGRESEYDQHTAIFESYLDIDLKLRSSRPNLRFRHYLDTNTNLSTDADVHSHFSLSPSTSEEGGSADNYCQVARIPSGEYFDDSDELATPTDSNHRGTFGYGPDDPQFVDVFDAEQDGAEEGVQVQDFRGIGGTVEFGQSMHAARASFDHESTLKLHQEGHDVRGKAHTVKEAVGSKFEDFDDEEFGVLAARPSGFGGRQELSFEDGCPARPNRPEVPVFKVTNYHLPGNRHGAPSGAYNEQKSPTPACLIGRPIMHMDNLNDHINGSDTTGTSLQPALPISIPPSVTNVSGSSPSLDNKARKHGKREARPPRVARHDGGSEMSESPTECVSSFIHLTPEPSPRKHGSRVRRFWARATGRPSGPADVHVQG